MGFPIEVETEVRDSTEHPPADVALRPQQQAEFQPDSPTTSQPPTSPTPPYANVDDENATASLPTPDDIRLIKYRNLVEALRKLQQIRRLSTYAPPLSTVVGDSSKLHVEVVFILQQLKASLCDDGFLDALKKHGEVACDIFKILDSLALRDLPASMVKYFVEFKAFFTQFTKELNLRQNVDFQINMKLNEAKIEWDSSEACE